MSVGSDIHAMVVPASSDSLHRRTLAKVRQLESLAAAVRSPRPLDAVMELVIEQIGEVVPSDATAVWLYDGDKDLWHIGGAHGLTRRASLVRFESSRTLHAKIGDQGEILTNLNSAGFRRLYPEHDLIQCALYAPMKVAGKRVGLIALYRNTNEAFTEDDLAFVRTIGSHVGMAISFVALEARAERLAVLDERARIGADLHDGILQILSSVRVYALELRSSLDAIRDEMDRERATPAYIALSKLEDCVDTGSEEVTAAIRQFREPDACLDVRTHLDIARDRLEASGIATTVECDIRDIASEVSDAVGWIVREAASNVLHHSQAEHVTIDVHTSGDSLELLIADDGVGGRASTDRRGAAFDERPLGQKIMRERAEHLGGQLTVVAGTGGTTVRARMPAVPLREEASRIRVPGD